MSGKADPGINLHAQPQDGKVAVRISPDGMEAHLTIFAPRPGGQPVSYTQALAALTKAGVTFGLDTDSVEKLVRNCAQLPAGESSRSALVARGKPPARGHDAVMTYHDLLQLPSGTPQMRADGSVDHFQLNLVRNVTPSTVLVSRTPPTKGEPGTSVLGSTVPCQDGKDHPLRAGKGCKLSEDGLSLIAEVEGHAVQGSDGRVNVSPIFEIAGDVDTSTGNIDFIGTVIVRGNVNLGFSVRAGENVEIQGGIDGGIVEAGGDITVRYGIQGGLRGRVSAGGRIQCRFVENADLRCGRDLLVSDGVLHSKVRCGGKVLVVGRRGTIIGGQVKAKEEVASRVLGSSLLTTTEIEVGVAPETRDELEAVRRSLAEAEEGLRKSMHAVQLLRDLEFRNPAEFSAEKRATLMKALRSQYHWQAQRDQLAKRREALEDEVQGSGVGRVRAIDTAYPGVKVMIGKQSYVVVDSLQHVSFYLSDLHEITLGTA